MPIKYKEFSEAIKIEKFQLKIFDIFVFAKNIDFGYLTEPPHQGGSNKYPQSMFWNKNKKKCIALLTPVLLNKSGERGF